MGTDGVLYLAVSGTLVLVDRRNRWPDFTLMAPGFRFWRLAALPEGGVMALDRRGSQLGRVTGLPPQVEPSGTPDPGILRSCQTNPGPVQLAARYPLPAAGRWAAIAAMPNGQFALLSWQKDDATNTKAFLHLFNEATGAAIPWTLAETAFPLGWSGSKSGGS